MDIRHLSRRTAARAAVIVAGMLAPAVGDAQAQVVRGFVVAVGDGAPISDALLVLRDASGELRAAAISARNGAFELRSDAPGLVRLEVSHLGYAAWGTSNFALASDAVIQVEVKLGIEAIPLDPITVLAEASPGGRLSGFEQRRQAPGGFGGYFLTESEIERRPAAKPSSLVLGTPGMGLSRAGNGVGLDRSLIMAGDCVARTFVDGIRVDQSPAHSIDDLLPVESIAGIEMYPRAMAAPAQYQDAGQPHCGVVLFWTREPRAAEVRPRSFRRIAVGLGILAGILTVGIVG